MYYRSDDRVIVSVVDLLHDKLKPIKYKPGFTAKSINSDHGNSRAYSTILFKLMELMIMDVIAGNIVYFDRKVKSMFYVDFYPAPEAMIRGEGRHENNKIDLIDFSVTRYRVPFIAFDPGYKNSTVCFCHIPPYLYNALIQEVNNGRTYPKSTKVYFANKNQYETI